MMDSCSLLALPLVNILSHDFCSAAAKMIIYLFAGGVFTYLAKLPMLGDAAGTRLAYLTSLLEVNKCITHQHVIGIIIIVAPQMTIVNNVEEVI